VLKLIKEYIDAKAEYDAIMPRSSAMLSPTATLTANAAKVRDRYFAAEKAFNEAIANEEFEFKTLSHPD